MKSVQDLKTLMTSLIHTKYFCAKVLLPRSFTGAIAVYVACSIVATICCFFLPIETRDRDLKDQTNTTQK